MSKAFLTGALLAVAAVVIVLLGEPLGASLQQLALLAAALGGALALGQTGSWWGAPAAFVVGLLVSWIGYGVRALLLPDSTGGRAVAAFLVVLVVASVVALAGGRLPLWAALLGIVAMVAAYERAYTDSPSAFLSASPAAATTVLLGVGIGYLAGSVLAVAAPQGEGAGGRHSSAAQSKAAEGDLDTIITEAGS